MRASSAMLGLSARTSAPVRLVLLDAFGTLLRPRIAPHLQYGEEAHKLGIEYDADKLAPAFKQAFKHLAAAHPSYAPLGPDAWWTRLIVRTFAECAPSASSSQVTGELAPRLLRRFASKEAYELFPETLEALQALRALPPARAPDVVLASNGDARIVAALRQLLAAHSAAHLLELRPGLRLSPRLTWDLRASKPERAFFRRVLARVGAASEEQAEGEGERWDEMARQTLVVGDMQAEDYDGARAAGTQVLLLDRNGTQRDVESDVRIESLNEVALYVQQANAHR
ncbi:HAD-like protein [Tilletiopsis washingtonensis]|uniref:HAD-like protein n=1 Tax=Tilletiopsis washingtonensis TaxID=58919 RepID=A0A316Z9K7_9BASI|nr:HAD-like protein [Tilletiopsis washingtonensis]PWN96945.1 HAD-like protein [Tilletiopsis washingtonensis]